MDDLTEKDIDPYHVKMKEEDTRLVELVLGAELVVACEETVAAEFELPTPIDFEGRRGNRRLSRVSVKRTRLLGERDVHPDEDDSPIFLRANGLVQPLTKKGEPKEREWPYWTDLPDDLVGVLLGRAAVSP